jgi:hypothetical protein
MKRDWVEIIAAEMHKTWMDLRVEEEGEEKARKHKHFKEWGPDLQSADDGVEAMNQDRFVAALIVRGYCKAEISKQSDLPAFIHNSVQLWIRLTGEELKPWHVPYLQSTTTSINERMKKERTTQARRVWPLLQQISNIEEIRDINWIQ